MQATEANTGFWASIPVIPLGGVVSQATILRMPGHGPWEIEVRWPRVNSVGPLEYDTTLAFFPTRPNRANGLTLYVWERRVHRGNVVFWGSDSTLRKSLGSQPISESGTGAVRVIKGGYARLNGRASIGEAFSSLASSAGLPESHSFDLGAGKGDFSIESFCDSLDELQPVLNQLHDEDPGFFAALERSMAEDQVVPSKQSKRSDDQPHVV